MTQNFKNLKVYEEAFRLSKDLYIFFDGRQVSLRAKEQVLASASSICANLAEMAAFESKPQQRQKIMICIGEANETDMEKKYILYGNNGAGPIRGIDLNGNDRDKKIGNLGSERIPTIFFVRNSPWIATSVENATTGYSYIALRSWISGNAIILGTGDGSTAAAGLDVAFDGTNFIVTYNTDRGALKVVTLPENSPRHQF